MNDWVRLIASATTSEELRQSVNLFNFVSHSGHERRQFLRMVKEREKEILEGAQERSLVVSPALSAPPATL